MEVGESWQAGAPLDQAFRAADLALYEAKKSGRNRLVAGLDGVEVPENYPDGWLAGAQSS